MRTHFLPSVLALASTVVFPFAAFAQTNVVTNGSFESGLTGWTQTTADVGTGTCSYNAAIVTGSETLTGIVPGLAPTNGTTLALGSVHLTAGGRVACYLYQDVAIPAGATTATLSGDLGIQYLNGMVTNNAALEIGLYPATSIPTDLAARIGGAALIYREPGGNVSDTALHTTSGTFNVSSVAGMTARLIIINVVDSTTGTSLVGIDNIQLLVSVTPAPTVSSVSPVSGSLAGGTSVTITGTGFTGATGATIGGTAATNVTVLSDTSITLTTPAGTVGPASVLVTTGGGVNVGNTLYTYTNAATSAPPPLQISYVSPVSLQAVQNESLMVSGTVTVLANQNGSWQATTATPWLTLTQFAGGFPGVVAMTANAGGLTAGTYTGSVTVSSGGLTIAVPVTLTVLPPQSITANPPAISFAASYPAASATGYAIQMGPAGVAFSAQISATSSGWLSISPTSGVAPATIYVTVDPTKASPGSYQGSIAITSPGAPNSPLTVPVKLGVSQILATLPQQVNSATGAGPDHTVAPNEIVSLFPSDFSCSAQPVVSINGTPVTWSSYVPGQINYAVPATVTQGAILSLACNGATGWSFNGLNVAATMPGIFTMSAQGTGQAAAVNGDGTVNSATNAMGRGGYVSVYVSGFGVFSAASASGLRNLAGTVTAQIGGIATTVQYSGESPGNTDGLQQINLLIPANSPVGASVPVVLWVNGTPTQTTATIAVK